MSRGRFWMYDRDNRKGYIGNEFKKGVEEFVDFAFSQLSCVSQNKIRCPCLRCENKKFQTRDVVTYHLYAEGCINDYEVWIAHGEFFISNQVVGESSIGEDVVNPYRRMVMDATHYEFDSHAEEPRVCEELPNHTATKFFSLLKDADEPLWGGCEKHIKLSAVSQLLNVKSEFNMSEACYDRIMTIVKEMLPKDEKLAGNFYQAKQMVTKLGLGYNKIHACENNCMLFFAETESMNECLVCGHPRYKITSGNGKKNKVPYKVLRYLPLILRLQRLYLSSKTSEHMTWHARGRSTDGKLRHPVDGEAWQHFDRIHPSFARETRNVRLGLCTDGFNPFGSSATPYSCWPVIIVVYNLPPWMCMKQQYFLLNMVIPGPKSPVKHIDVFLQPLIDELKLFWDVGVETYDAFRRQNFQLKAALMWTISDFPAYAMLSGWSTHGRLSCPYCMERSKAFRLDYGGKTSFFDCHRQFLPLNHPYRKQKDKFKIGMENDPPFQRLSGEEMFSRVRALPQVIFGKLHEKEKITGFGESHNWVKRSIFWELPYWHSNLIRHNLDVMHIERNVFENLFNTIMDVKGKSKDNVKARMYMKVLCKRPNLELVEHSGKIFKPKASFTLSKEQIEDVCKWIKALKFPDGYVSNIATNVHDGTKFYGFKSHDCHVFMQRLFPIAFRDLLPNPIWEAITEMSHFFKDICSTELEVEGMEILEKNIVETLCKLEKIFPPGFFDSMEHLPIHLAYEAKVGGPVHYRWMYPFERSMSHYKKMVTNRAHVEASICGAFIVEEITTFCSYYFDPNLPTRLNRVPRNDDGGEVEAKGRLSIFTHPGRVFGPKGDSRYLLDDEYKAAEIYVLLNCEEIWPYVEKFDEAKRTEKSNLSDGELEKLRGIEFSSWFKSFVSNSEVNIDSCIEEVTYGPSRMATFYKGYFVNGFKFHTHQNGQNRQTMNYGVCVKGSCYNDYDCDFYGILEDVVELTYVGTGNKVVLFKCRWFDTEKGVRVHPHYGLVDVNYKSKLSTNEPFVLAQQVQQVYYTSYPSKRRERRDWWAVCKIKARSRFEMSLSGDKEQIERFDGFYQDDESVPVHILPSFELDDASVIAGEGGLELVDSILESQYENQEERSDSDTDDTFFEESEEDNISTDKLEFNLSTSEDDEVYSEDIEIDD